MTGERIIEGLCDAASLAESWVSGASRVWRQEGIQGAAGWGAVSRSTHLSLSEGFGPLLFGMEPTLKAKWNLICNRLEKNKVSEQVVWEAYRENVQHILDELGTSLKNFQTRKIIISVEHGNAFGVFSSSGYPLVLISTIRTDLLRKSSVSDKRTRQPNVVPPEQDSSFSRDEQPQALGYKWNQ